MSERASERASEREREREREREGACTCDLSEGHLPYTVSELVSHHPVTDELWLVST